MIQVPGDWRVVAMNQVCEPVSKMEPKATGRKSIRYIDIGSVDGSTQRLMEVQEIEAATAPARARQVVAAGDTIFSTVRPYLTKIAFIDLSLDGEFASTGFCVLRPKEEVHPRWLYYFATSAGLLDQVLPLQRGVSYPAVRDRDVLSSLMPVPPLEEQRRIVAILEDHLSRLDAGITALPRVDIAVAALRRSVWNRLFATGEFRDLPLGEVADVAWGDTSTTKASYVDSGYLAFSASGPDGLLDHFDYEEDGIVLSAIGAQCGKTWSAQGRWSCIKNTMRILPRHTEIDLRYLSAFLSNREIWPKRGSGQPFIRQQDARLVAVPTPDRNRQRLIAEVWENVASRSREALAACERAQTYGGALRRKLLAAAFSGQLTRESISV